MVQNPPQVVPGGLCTRCRRGLFFVAGAVLEHSDPPKRYAKRTLGSPFAVICGTFGTSELRWPKMAKLGPSWPQVGPKLAQVGPKSAQVGTKLVQNGPKRKGTRKKKRKEIGR